ncbi:MAG TPA: cytochrome c nitrite reductase small subunit [Ignavibacteriaceae bacterium]|nr:cytochrome c nitrite reductase small subunit [Ignavibacteriaceae bacterium]
MNLRAGLFSLFPPPKWRIPVIIALGTFSGLLLLILRISNAFSYLSDDPRACINCHVMTTEYASWQRSSHARVATCNDCHVPHSNPLSKYAFKANDGLRHAFMFTFRLEPQVIQIKEAGADVVQLNCMRCHENQLHRSYLSKTIDLEDRNAGIGRFCWDCHRETPHGRVKSLSAYPYARVPELESAVPEWLQEISNLK